MYADPVSQRPAWLAISTGFFGTRLGTAPVDGATRLGADVVIAHDRSQITSSPPVDVNLTISDTDNRRLNHHYLTLPPAESGQPLERRHPQPHLRHHPHRQGETL